MKGHNAWHTQCDTGVMCLRVAVERGAPSVKRPRLYRAVNRFLCRQISFPTPITLSRGGSREPCNVLPARVTCRNTFHMRGVYAHVFGCCEGFFNELLITDTPGGKFWAHSIFTCRTSRQRVAGTNRTRPSSTRLQRASLIGAAGTDVPGHVFDPA